MNVKDTINKKINKVKHVNKKKTEAYKKRLENQILTNLKDGKPAQDQKVLYSRYCNAKPQELTQMQQALAEAAQ